MSMPHAIRTPTRLDLILMVMTALMLASGFVAIRVVAQETGPLWLAASRVSISLLVLLPYAIWRGMVWPATRRQWATITGMAMLTVVVPFFLTAWAGRTIEAGVLSLLMGSGPFLALIGSHFMTIDDRMTTRKIVSVLLGFSGIMALVGPSMVAGLGGGALAAKLAVLGATFSYVIAGLLIRRIAMPPVRLACLVLAIGTAILIPLALIAESPPLAGLSTPALGALIYLGLIPTGLAYILRFTLIRNIGYSRFSLSSNLIPVFGVALGVIVLGEPLSLKLIIALTMVLAGLIIASGGKKPQSLPQSGENA